MMISRRFCRPIAVAAALTTAGCASEYTVITRDQIHPSPATRIAAQNLTPASTRDPEVAAHLAIAAEVYDRQLALLKDRRNEVRARRRSLNQLAIATLAATAAGVATTALVVGSKNADDGLRASGAGSLGGLLLGSSFEIVGTMQEDPEAVDGKIRRLDSLYGGMLEKLRALETSPRAESTPPSGRTDEGARVHAAAIIEDFITQALAINVKG